MPPLAGERWWRQPPKGECISNARRAVVWFFHGRKPGCMVFAAERRHLYWRPKGRRTSPAQRCYITPEGGALNPPVRRSRSQAEPWQPRAVRPGGAINPRPQGVNLREYSFPPNPSQRPIISNDTHSKKALTITVSAF